MCEYRSIHKTLIGRNLGALSREIPEPSQYLWRKILEPCQSPESADGTSPVARENWSKIREPSQVCQGLGESGRVWVSARQLQNLPRLLWNLGALSRKSGSLVMIRQMLTDLTTFPPGRGEVCRIVGPGLADLQFVRFPGHMVIGRVDQHVCVPESLPPFQLGPYGFGCGQHLEPMLFHEFLHTLFGLGG